MRRLIAAAVSILSCSLLATSAWALPVDLKIHFLKPPNLDLGTYQSLGIAEISGWYGVEMESALVSALMDERRGLGGLEGIGPEDPAVFWPNQIPLVERSRLDLVLSEIRLGESGLTDEATRAQLGELMGAGLLLTGTISAPTFQDEFRTETETEELDDGTEHTYTLHCVDREVRLVFALRAIDSTTGVIRSSEELYVESSETACDRDSKKAILSVPDVDSMALPMLPSLAYEAANGVAPYWGDITFKLERNKDTGKGIKTIKKDDDPRASARYFVDLANADPYNDWAQYHAAVLLAIHYHFDEAYERLSNARSINDRPRFKKFQQRLDRLVGWNGRLAELGMVIEPLDLGGARQGGPATSSDRSVVVKGGAKKSIQMFSEPGSGSVVAKLPGKMTLSVLEERGGWLKVRTFDGKEGWVEAEEVK